MKTTANSLNPQVHSRTVMAIVRLLSCAVFFLAAHFAFGQTTYEWTGGAADFRLGSANNWTPNATPSSAASDIMQWDATAATGNLIVTYNTAMGYSAGLNNNVTAE